MDTFPPAEKVQQLICIAGQSDIRHASKELAIQVAIDPVDFTACGLLNDTERTACVAGRRLVDNVELHGRALSRSKRNSGISPP